MDLTIACKYFSPRGGAQTFLFNFVHYLLEHNHRVKVLAMEIKGKMEGVEAEIIPMPLVTKTFRDVVFARATRKALQQDKHDLSFGEQKTWGADVVRPGGGVHKEYISQVIKSYPSAPMRALRSITKRLSLKERLNLHIERKLYADPELRCVIANSPLLQRHLVKHYHHLADRIEVVYNGADPERFSPKLRTHRDEIRRQHNIPENALLNIFVAYDVRRKGLDTTLRALSILKKKDTSCPIRLLVVGKKKSWAVRLAKQLDVSALTSFTGLQDPEPYYGASDVLVLPSYFDPCANVTLEALSCGLPVITSVENGAYELLTPQIDGFYVDDPADAAQLAGFIEYFTDEAKLRRSSEAARERALQHTLTDMCADIMNVLEPLAEKKNWTDEPK
ncbi:MAG: glycosyltransferase family 4 protein [Candidatus Brocadiia bacterium]